MSRIKVLVGVAVGLVAALGTVGAASAHECVNISKLEQNPGAGAQVILDGEDNIVWATNGVMKRVEQGLIDPDTGEGFHGIIGFAPDGENVEFSTFIVTPEGEIPEEAQANGSPDHGIINICDIPGACE